MSKIIQICVDPSQQANLYALDDSGVIHCGYWEKGEFKWVGVVLPPKP